MCPHAPRNCAHMSRAAKYPTCSNSGRKWKIFAAQNVEIFHNRVKSGFFVFVNVKDTDFMRYSKNGTQHVFCLKYLVTVILMGQNVDKWVKYFNGCCMWTNETLLSVSGCNEPHVAGGSAGGARVYLLVFTWYLYWRIWSLLQLSAVSPGLAIIQLLSHQLPVTTSTRRTQGHEPRHQQQCRGSL